MADKTTPPKGAILLPVAGQEDLFTLQGYLTKIIVDDNWHNFRDFDRVLSNGNLVTATDGSKWLVANGIKDNDVAFTGNLLYSDRDVIWYDVPTAYTPPPEAPTNLRASTLNDARIMLNWDAPTDMTVQVERATSDKGPWSKSFSSSDGTRIEINLEPSTKYYYRVRAINDGGTSAYSEIASATSGPYKMGGGTVDVATPLPTGTVTPTPTVVTQYIPTPVAATTPATTTQPNPTKSWLENNLTLVLGGGVLLIMVVMVVIANRD